MKPENVKVGATVNYSPILGRGFNVPVVIESEPYALGDGTLICKARRLTDGRNLYPCLEALKEST